MPQLFKRSSNTIARAALVAASLGVVFSGWLLHAVYWSPYTTRVGLPLAQPVPFSHEHHVGGLGLDCRYCHTSVEKSAFAGLPATEICMTCHSQLYTDTALLAPVRESFTTGRPIHWKRVNYLPDFVYFNHSIHVNKGIGCASCHGEVDKMPLMWKQETLYMKFCIQCHSAPEQQIRPTNEVLNLHWTRPANQRELGNELVAQYHVNVTRLTDCSNCHR